MRLLPSPTSPASSYAAIRAVVTGTQLMAGCRLPASMLPQSRPGPRWRPGSGVVDTSTASSTGCRSHHCLYAVLAPRAGWLIALRRGAMGAQCPQVDTGSSAGLHAVQGLIAIMAWRSRASCLPWSDADESKSHDYDHMTLSWIYQKSH